MAITMSGATVDSSNREALLNSEVDKNVLGNKVNNPFELNPKSWTVYNSF